MESENKLKASSVEDVLKRFRKIGPQTVEFKGSKFIIRKLNAAEAFFAPEVLALPFVAGALENWKNLSKEEKAKAAGNWVSQKEYNETLRKVTVLSGVVEPKFSDQIPTPDGCLPYGEMDEELLEFLSVKIMFLSNMDAASSDFFRTSTSS